MVGYLLISCPLCWGAPPQKSLQVLFHGLLSIFTVPGALVGRVFNNLFLSLGWRALTHQVSGPFVHLHFSWDPCCLFLSGSCCYFFFFPYFTYPYLLRLRTVCLPSSFCLRHFDCDRKSPFPEVFGCPGLNAWIIGNFTTTLLVSRVSLLLCLHATTKIILCVCYFIYSYLLLVGFSSFLDPLE